ncbi:MAG: signal peptidase I [Armatimonadetes bacterium]|nr:signal peptidase I [Armatimonadota bacterium]
MADRKTPSQRWRVWERVLLLAGLAGAACLRLFLVLPAYVSSPSMEPTLRVGDYFLINRTAYRRRPPRPGDIVAFHSLHRAEVWVKRAVAGESDQVALHRGVLLRNGVPVAEPYIRQRLGLSYRPERVPPGHVFVLGDNRDTSDDSRHWGPLRRDFLVGKVLFVYWPPGRIGRPR